MIFLWALFSSFLGAEHAGKGMLENQKIQRVCQTQTPMLARCQGLKQ